MFTASDIHYEIADRTRAISCGGIGALHALARQVGLIDAIDRRLHLLKFHFPYHESDHVLTFAYNALCDGTCLQDLELRRQDEVFHDALGAHRIPDPTTAGDFCRRFDETTIRQLQDLVHDVRVGVWAEQPADFFDRAILDMDGFLVETTGQCKEGMDIGHDGTWGYHALVLTLANTGEVLGLVNRPANRPSHEGAAAEVDRALAVCFRGGFPRYRESSNAVGPRGHKQGGVFLTTRALGVLQSAVGADKFFDRAAQALVQVVGLDTGRVLLRQPNGWSVKAVHGAAADDPAWRPSRHVLDKLLKPPPALVWQEPRRAQEPGSASLSLLDAVVAAPLLDRNNQVIGALYGERLQGRPQACRSDGQVERLLVNLLACGVATGLARLEQEQATLQATVRFEQFFSRDLAQHLAADPGLLEPRQADVTVLFADVRGFSKHSEKLSPADTFRWLNEVLDELSRCVRDEGGVLVDYVGDELFALWGAPAAQPDQAARAARAALAMHAALPGLNQQWQPLLGEPIRLGVGLNSGRALVGNTGSQYKFKYGPRGHTVNVGSRVQGLTKYLRCGVLATAATRWLLGDGFIARRVIKTRVVNIEEPVDLYEIERAGAPQRRAFFADSEAALDTLETGDLAMAARLAGQLLTSHGGDGPLLITLARAAEALVQGGTGFNPVWTPPGK